jgi:hypothetical protein
MSITFARNGKTYELGLDGSVKADGAAFGTWTTNEDNHFQVTAKSDGAVFTQPARWATKENRLSVTPDGGTAVEFLDATEGDIQFRLTNNRLVIDPLPDEDEFSFSLTGDWSLATDYSALQLTAGNDTLVFTGGLNDSQSRFIWRFEAKNAAIKKIFSLRFDGAWKMKKRSDGKAGILAVFAFEYTMKGQTTKDTFELPVDVTADAENGNRLLFTYQRAGSSTQWGVAFAGRFTTKGSSIIGYSAEVYDDNGQIASRFTFSFKGKIKNGSLATRNSLQFEVTIAGQTVNLTLSGHYDFTKSTLSFSLQLNTSTKTGEISSLTFGLTVKNKTDGTMVNLTIKADGSAVTVSLCVGADVKLGGSRKGSAYGKLDMKLNGKTVGIDVLFGITLN